MRGDRLPVNILTLQTIANVTPQLGRALGLQAHHRAVGIVSTNCDDVTYLALDEATKKANVDVVYAESFYAGAANASTRLQGEVIGVLAGPSPSEVESGLAAARDFLASGVGFQSACNTDDVVYLAYCQSRTGSFLAKTAHVPQGQAIAYLIAPPVEAVMGLDAALKSSDVELAEFFPPPTQTNFSGGLLTGTESACRAACLAFARAVEAVAEKPKAFGG